MYGASELAKEEIIKSIKEQLAMRAKTEFVLNILCFADFGRWGTADLGELVAYFEEMLEPAYEENRIVLSYNPILTICLACQHLTSIGNAISQYKHQGQSLC